MSTLNNVKTVPNNNTGENKEQKMIGSLPEDSVLEFESTTFKTLGETTRITNKELCEIIKAKFSETFHDLRGVMIHYYNTETGPRFVTEFYFEQNGDKLKEGQIKNLESLTQSVKSSKSFLQGQQAIYNKLNGRMFTLNAETRLLLSDYMLGGRKGNHPNDNKKWEQNIRLVDSQSRFSNNPMFPPNAHELFVMVSGLDLRRLLNGCVFGDTMVTETRQSSDGKITNVTTRAFYEPRYMKPLPGVNGVFVMNIERFDKNAVEQYMAQENPMIYNAPNGVPFF